MPKITSVSKFTRPDTSAPFWPDSSVYQENYGNSNLYSETTPEFESITKVYSPDNLTYTITYVFPDTEKQTTHWQRRKSMHIEWREARLQYLRTHNHHLEISTATEGISPLTTYYNSQIDPNYINPPFQYLPNSQVMAQIAATKKS